MLSRTQQGALRVLEALQDEETAYTVNMSNPVCPCCGAKLIIQDDIGSEQNQELNTNNLDEQFADPEVIIPLVSEVANDIVSGYTEYCRTANLTDKQIAQALIYPQDKELKEAIARKAKELKSMFSSGYGLIVNESIIISDLREAIRKVVSRMFGSRRI